MIIRQHLAWLVMSKRRHLRIVRRDGCALVDRSNGAANGLRTSSDCWPVTGVPHEGRRFFVPSDRHACIVDDDERASRAASFAADGRRARARQGAFHPARRVNTPQPSRRFFSVGGAPAGPRSTGGTCALRRINSLEHAEYVNPDDGQVNRSHPPNEKSPTCSMRSAPWCWPTVRKTLPSGFTGSGRHLRTKSSPCETACSMSRRGRCDPTAPSSSTITRSRLRSSGR